VKVAAALGLGLVLLAAGVTAWALESGSVLVLESVRPDGSARATHVWFAERAGELWLEAATPERAWLADLTRTPRVRVRRDEITRGYDAQPVPGEGPRRQVRAALRAKYGWRDAWVALFQDTSRAVAVRLRPAP